MSEDAHELPPLSMDRPTPEDQRIAAFLDDYKLVCEKHGLVLAMVHSDDNQYEAFTAFELEDGHARQVLGRTLIEVPLRGVRFLKIQED